MLPKALSRSLAKDDKPSHHVSNITGTTYTNPWPSAGKPTWSELLAISNPFSLYSNHNLHAHERARDVKVVIPDWGEASLREQGAETHKEDYIIGTWLGHAGVMIEIPIHHSDRRKENRSLRVLIDPIFSERAGPTTYTGPSRLHSTPCTITDLQGCDVVLISHNHYDHLDAPTLRLIIKQFPKCKVFVPLGNASSLPSSIPRGQISELDWWKDVEFDAKELLSPASPFTTTKFRFTCVPAQHNSGRTGVDGGNALWCGWVIEEFISSAQQNKDETKASRTRVGAVYHAGDTGYRRHTKSAEVCPIFEEIGKKFGPFDLSFLPIWRGGTLSFFSSIGLRLSHHEIPSTFHASPKDAIDIHKDVRSKNSVGVHFGTFIGAVEESLEAVIELDEASEEAGVTRLDAEDGGLGRAGVIDIGGSIAVRMEKTDVS